MKKKQVVICDIDGVLIENPLWDTLENFYENIMDGWSNLWCEKLLNGLISQGVHIIFVTARNYRFHSFTKLQLRSCVGDKFDLYMRDKDDLRPDWQVKKDYLVELKEKYNILFCIDDNIDNCNMYKDLGLVTLQVK